MTVQPDDSVRCRCGSSTYVVNGSDSLRTCSVCGYLTSFCRCGGTRVPPRTGQVSLNVSERTRGMVGAAIVASLGTMFAMTMLSSPFFALFGLGIPFALTAGFFAQWLRGEAPAVAVAADAVPPAPAATGRVNA
ncbi:MAG TPA: hypothetical protein VJR06_01975 [Nitrososphaerales archaeon]|nr:hypothetical protein [Nitrososphaerales archaeon]